MVACNGVSTVPAFKIACPTCLMRGFVHSANERAHDVSETLRCFFCKDCPTCKGAALQDVRKSNVPAVPKEGIVN